MRATPRPVATSLGPQVGFLDDDSAHLASNNYPTCTCRFFQLMIGLTLCSFLAALLSGDRAPTREDPKQPCCSPELGRVQQEHVYPLANNYALIIKEIDAKSAEEYHDLLAADAVNERHRLDKMQTEQGQNYTAAFAYVWVVDASDGESMLVTQASPDAFEGGLSESHCIANRMLEEQSHPGIGCWPRKPGWGTIRSSKEGEPEVVDVSTGACVGLTQQLVPALTRVANEYVLGQLMCSLGAKGKAVHI